MAADPAARATLPRPEATPATGLAERADAIGSGGSACGCRAAANGSGSTGQSGGTALGGEHGPAASGDGTPPTARPVPTAAPAPSCGHARHDAVGDAGAEDAEAEQR